MAHRDVAPPGREAQVEKLKELGAVENPWAVAWASYNKSADAAEVAVGQGALVAVDAEPEHLDVIRKRGGAFVLLAKSTGKVLGTHETKASAEKQEAAIKASQARSDDRPRVHRRDQGMLRPAERQANGWLRVEGRSARTGILEYENTDGSVRRELVLPEELFSPASMATARMVPVVSPHPAGLLDDTTARGLAVGGVGEGLRVDGDHLAAPLNIWDRDTVTAVEGGRTGLSWGYDCTLDPPDPSLFAKWGQHDAIQRNREYNHLAIIDMPRAGPDARIRLDGTGNVERLARSPVLVVASRPSPAEVPVRLQIGTHYFDATETNMAVIQEAITRELGDQTAARAKAEKDLTEVTKARADGDTKIAAIKERVADWRQGLKAKLDAMKARMVACDECGGTGEVPSEEEDDKMETCGYCDGAGKVRFHDAVKAMPPAPPDDDDDDDEDEEDDDAFEASPDDDLEDMEDDLSREPESEEKIEKAANKEHKDARRRARKDRATARKALVAKRIDALERRSDRRSRARGALLAFAGQHLDAADLKTKSDAEIRKAVLAKIAPHLKLDGKSNAAIAELYAGEVARMDAQGGAPSDIVRAGVKATPAATNRKISATHNDHAQKVERAMQDAWKNPRKQPTIE